MTNFLQLAFQGLALGMVYGLIALGFVIVFKSSGTFNFAHGQFVALGGYLVIAFSATQVYLVGLVGAILVMVAVALLVEALLLRRLVGSSATTVVLATLGISIMLQSLTTMIWGVESKGTAGPTGSGTVDVGGVVLSWSGIATVVTSVVLVVALSLFFRKTSYGLGLRATASHQEAAIAQGIDVRRMFAIAWAIAAVLAVVAAIFLASYPRQVSPSIGVVALVALPAIVIGGFDSLVGAVVGGLTVGQIQVLGSGYLSDYGGGRLHEVLPYVLMFVVLVVRPYGLFGTRTVERV